MTLVKTVYGFSKIDVSKLPAGNINAIALLSSKYSDVLLSEINDAL